MLNLLQLFLAISVIIYNGYTDSTINLLHELDSNFKTNTIPDRLNRNKRTKQQEIEEKILKYGASTKKIKTNNSNIYVIIYNIFNINDLSELQAKLNRSFPNYYIEHIENPKIQNLLKLTTKSHSNCNKYIYKELALDLNKKAMRFDIVNDHELKCIIYPDRKQNIINDLTEIKKYGVRLNTMSNKERYDESMKIKDIINKYNIKYKINDNNNNNDQKKKWNRFQFSWQPFKNGINHKSNSEKENKIRQNRKRIQELRINKIKSTFTENPCNSNTYWQCKHCLFKNSLSNKHCLQCVFYK